MRCAMPARLRASAAHCRSRAFRRAARRCKARTATLSSAPTATSTAAAPRRGSCAPAGPPAQRGEQRGRVHEHADVRKLVRQHVVHERVHGLVATRWLRGVPCGVQRDQLRGRVPHRGAAARCHPPSIGHARPDMRRAGRGPTTQSTRDGPAGPPPHVLPNPAGACTTNGCPARREIGVTHHAGRVGIPVGNYDVIRGQMSTWPFLFFAPKRWFCRVSAAFLPRICHNSTLCRVEGRTTTTQRTPKRAQGRQRNDVWGVPLLLAECGTAFVELRADLETRPGLILSDSCTRAKPSLPADRRPTYAVTHCSRRPWGEQVQGRAQ